MNKKSFILSLVFLLLFLSGTIYGEEKKGATSLGRVVVSGETNDENRQTGDVVTEESSSFSTVIKRENFDGKITSLSEVIEKETGIQVRQSGGLGSFSQVSLRGASSQQVLIYLDGVLLNEASGGGIDLSTIPLSDVEAIEIYRGMTPISLGKSSIGGAINIRTRRSGKKGISGSAHMGYGSYNTYKTGAYINHKPGSFDYILSGNYVSSNNDFRFYNDQGTDFNSDDDRWDTRVNSAFDQKDLLVKLGYDFTKNIRLEFSNQFFYKYKELPDQLNQKIVETTLGTTRDVATVKCNINRISSLNINTSMKADYIYKNEEYDDSKNHLGLNAQHYKYFTSTYGYSQFTEWITEHNVLALVFDYHREEYKTEDLLKSKESHLCARNSFTGAIEDSVMLFNEKLIIKPGIRYFFINDNRGAGFDELDQAFPAVDESRHYVNPQVGVKYKALKWLIFKTNLARYVRYPSFFELFGDRGFFMGNDELKAEKGINFDAGTEIDIKRKKKTFSRIMIMLAYFRSDVDDLIAYTYNARGVGTAENISYAQIQGIEWKCMVDMFTYFSVAANYTWQEPMNQSEAQDADGKRLPGRNNHAMSGKVEARCSWGKIYYEYAYERGMYYDSPNLLVAPEKIDHSVGASLKFKGFLLTLEAKNIGNNIYEDYHSYPQPGRSYYATLKYTFKSETKKEKKEIKKKEIKKKEVKEKEKSKIDKTPKR